MKLITADMLAKAGACKDQVAIFRSVAPDGLAPTLKNLRLCRKAGIDVMWASNLLSAAASAEYGKVCAAASAEYDKVCDPASAEYDKVCAPASAEYGKVRDAALIKALRAQKG